MLNNESFPCIEEILYIKNFSPLFSFSVPVLQAAVLCLLCEKQSLGCWAWVGFSGIGYSKCWHSSRLWYQMCLLYDISYLCTEIVTSSGKLLFSSYGARGLSPGYMLQPVQFSLLLAYVSSVLLMLCYTRWDWDLYYHGK